MHSHAAHGRPLYRVPSDLASSARSPPSARTTPTGRSTRSSTCPGCSRRRHPRQDGRRGRGPEEPLPELRAAGSHADGRRAFHLASSDGAKRVRHCRIGRRSMKTQLRPGPTASGIVAVPVAFMSVQHRPEPRLGDAAPQVRTPANPLGPPGEQLESVLGATPHEFESRILRRSEGPHRLDGAGPLRSQSHRVFVRPAGARITPPSRPALRARSLTTSISGAGHLFR